MHIAHPYSTVEGLRRLDGNPLPGDANVRGLRQRLEADGKLKMTGFHDMSTNEKSLYFEAEQVIFAL